MSAEALGEAPFNLSVLFLETAVELVFVSTLSVLSSCETVEADLECFSFDNTLFMVLT